VFLAVGWLTKLALGTVVAPQAAGASAGWAPDLYSVLERSLLGQADLFAFGMTVAVLRVEHERGRLHMAPPIWMCVGAFSLVLVGGVSGARSLDVIPPDLYATLTGLGCAGIVSEGLPSLMMNVAIHGGIVLVLAAVTYRFVELPALQRKRRSAGSPVSPGAG
jgi:peptidoglycan/LPS O-acetylase OafA/YrhL